MEECYSSESGEQYAEEHLVMEYSASDQELESCEYLEDTFKNTECKLCHEYLESTTALKQHIESEHLNHKCAKCEKKFSTLALLRKHLRCAHLESMNLKCSFCDVILKTKYNLQQHLFTHTTNPHFQCPHDGCNKNFRHINSLKKHELIHQRRNRRQCPICQEYVTRLDSHILIHKIERPFACDICDRTYLTKPQLKAHKASHNGIIFQCELCNSKYKNISSLYKHRKSVHTNASHTCPVCRKEYNRQDNMVSHAKRVHGEVISTTDRVKRSNVQFVTDLVKSESED